MVAAIERRDPLHHGIAIGTAVLVDRRPLSDQGAGCMRDTSHRLALDIVDVEAQLIPEHLETCWSRRHLELAGFVAEEAKDRTLLLSQRVADDPHDLPWQVLIPLIEVGHPQRQDRPTHRRSAIL